ncbi:hypothetical protein M011DRAFT_474388 [Sporormia fimetaria CBS 119925]|uniref:non-specific serine/threonine protein kinase n=1 Tax=Sporormia fimetaria CBS 119925 TaxID=1340428 RepID=A0A6A6VMW4_9PLEO|nr:hypothetical protein M011DRAFT_474388 [Sporormia fimetaria CBS 119925]
MSSNDLAPWVMFDLSVGFEGDRLTNSEPSTVAETRERPRRTRNWSFDKMLTPLRGQKARTVSKESISRPIPDDRYPPELHSPLITLGGQPTPPYPESPSATTFPPFTARSPHTLTPPETASPPSGVRQIVRSESSVLAGVPQLAKEVAPAKFVRSNSAPHALECFIPPPAVEAFPKWLSSPTHSHAYPSLVGPQSPVLRGNPDRVRLPKATVVKESPTLASRRRRRHNTAVFIPEYSADTPNCLPDSSSPDILVAERSKSGLESADTPQAHRPRFRQHLSVPVEKQLEIVTKKLSRISEASPEAELAPAQECTQKLLATMDRSSLQPPPQAGTKLRAIQQAKETEALVAERAKRTGEDPPPYDFFELIGKGTYGRVFKGRSRNHGGLVAIKIIDTDKTDYEEYTSKNLQETLREINILQQLKDSRARPYVNIIEEARTVHNELWIVSEYMSGGSVHTLMKPRLQLAKAGLEEKYIIPIARELALGLKYIHEAGVIHRDLKSNNILISEEGRVQLCDFGVSGALEPEVAKRSTIVGTPNWMAPELQREWVKDINPSSAVRPNEILYGSEVDIWAYGCTLYEMATGVPPFHQTQPFLLPDAGIPKLEGEQYSDELKDLISFVLKPDPRERPIPDQILEHPYLAESTKMYPTVTLVALVEQYYRWEQGGGSRVSLFNPYGAQAPLPLEPEIEEDDDDWTFSTTEEWEKAHELPAEDAPEPEQGATVAPPEFEDRFAKLQATFMNQAADRGGKRLHRLFDPSAAPYRLSMADSESNRLSSDLALREFNPGAPNRETVIDLDFAAPTAIDLPSIDLGEVPTVKAQRLNKAFRDINVEEEDDYIDLDHTTRPLTREWKFPAMADSDSEPPPAQSNRDTMAWTFPTAPPEPPEPLAPKEAEKGKRGTLMWTFDAAMAESNRLSRRRDTKDFSFPPKEKKRDTRDFPAPARDRPDTSDFAFPPKERPATQEFTFPAAERPDPNAFVFPPRVPEDPYLALSSSPGPEPEFRRPSLRHAATEPLGVFDDYPAIQSARESPVRPSVIDLDMANIDEMRPSTSSSASTSTSQGMSQRSANPFDLEDQVHLPTTNHRASFHMKSQSEPNQTLPGLLTPQTFDENGNPTDLDTHPPAMHARGVSSASQVQFRPSASHVQYSRQRLQQLGQWDVWSHRDAFGASASSSRTTSPAPSISASDDDDLDDRWDILESQRYSRHHRPTRSRIHSRPASRLASTQDDDPDPRSDADDSYASESWDDTSTARQSRVSVGPNGQPLLDFPLPKGPDPDVLYAADLDPVAVTEALWKSSVELRDALRASRDLLRSMRLAEVEGSGEAGEG